MVIWCDGSFCGLAKSEKGANICKYEETRGEGWILLLFLMGNKYQKKGLNILERSQFKLLQFSCIVDIVVC